MSRSKKGEFEMVFDDTVEDIAAGNCSLGEGIWGLLKEPAVTGVEKHSSPLGKWFKIKTAFGDYTIDFATQDLLK